MHSPTKSSAHFRINSSIFCPSPGIPLISPLSSFFSAMQKIYSTFQNDLQQHHEAPVEPVTFRPRKVTRSGSLRLFHYRAIRARIHGTVTCYFFTVDRSHQVQGRVPMTGPILDRFGAGGGWLLLYHGDNFKSLLNSLYCQHSNKLEL